MASSASYQLKKYAKNIAPVTGEKISIRGAREHNLQNVDIDLPRNKLVVLSGLSGSGKSSLAFDTLFAEGQRRYMESLSSYARQFLGTMDKPDVDLIEGLSPAISIEQKSTNKNPRSTVGTITEIYDYYRLLFARIGHAHCPNCGREIAEQSIDQIIDTMMSWPEGTKVQILSPVVRGKKGEHQKVFEDARKAGFLRARVDGVMADLEDNVKLDKQKKHTIEIVVDRIIISPSVRKRLADSVETALKSSNGTIIVTSSLEEAAELANRKAPEHLELALAERAECDKLVSIVHNYGSLFIGH
ncbi:MAG: histidinol dehydrogenase, partial [Treponema socranskii subsp. buccale]